MIKPTPPECRIECGWCKKVMLETPFKSHACLPIRIGRSWNKFFTWLENLLFFNKFPHEDPCFGCNKASCVEPVKCKLIDENRFIM